MKPKLESFTDWLSDYIMRYGEPSEHELRLAAEDEARQFRVRVAELEAELVQWQNAAVSYWLKVTIP